MGIELDFDFFFEPEAPEMNYKTRSYAHGIAFTREMAAEFTQDSLSDIEKSYFI